MTGFSLENGSDEPVRPPRGTAALGVSAVVHGMVVVAALWLAQNPGDGAAPPAESGDAAVQLVYVPPAGPRVVVPVAPPVEPEARPRRPAAPHTPPRPEHHLPAGRPPDAERPSAEPPELPAPAGSIQPEAERAPPAAGTPAPAPAAPAAPPTAAPTAEAEMIAEAQRIFGRRRSGTPGGGPAAAPGFDVALPPQADECRPLPPREPGAPVELATVSGRVYREGTRIPLAGAHLQLIGSPHVAFSDANGAYTLRFDPALVDRCRTQYVRVTAPGFRAQTLVLYLGPSGGSDIPMRRQ